LEKYPFFLFWPNLGTGRPSTPLPFPPSGLLRSARWRPGPLSAARPDLLGSPPTRPASCCPAPRSARLSAPAAPLPFLSLRSWPARQPPRAHSAARALLSLHRGSRLSEPPPSTFLLPRCPFPFSARRWRSPKRQATATVSSARQVPAPLLPFLLRRAVHPPIKNSSRAPVFSLSRPLEARTHRRRSSAVPMPRTLPPTTS